MGVVKDIISRPLNYTLQNHYLKILIRCVLEIDERWGGIFNNKESCEKKLNMGQWKRDFQSYTWWKDTCILLFAALRHPLSPHLNQIFASNLIPKIYPFYGPTLNNLFSGGNCKYSTKAHPEKSPLKCCSSRSTFQMKQKLFFGLVRYGFQSKLWMMSIKKMITIVLSRYIVLKAIYCSSSNWWKITFDYEFHLEAIQRKPYSAHINKCEKDYPNESCISIKRFSLLCFLSLFLP